MRCEVATGSPQVELLEAVERYEADLLAMTTHGGSGPSRWLFGSVAEAMVRHAKCPLFVQRIASV